MNIFFHLSACIHKLWVFRRTRLHAAFLIFQLFKRVPHSHQAEIFKFSRFISKTYIRRKIWNHWVASQFSRHHNSCNIVAWQIVINLAQNAGKIIENDFLSKKIDIEVKACGLSFHKQHSLYMRLMANLSRTAMNYWSVNWLTTQNLLISIKLLIIRTL